MMYFIIFSLFFLLMAYSISEFIYYRHLLSTQKADSISEEAVLLPITAEGLLEFISTLVDEYGLPRGDDTSDAIATQILHLPQTKAYMPKSYFGNGVLKSMANKAAFDLLKVLADKRKEAEKIKLEETQKSGLTLVDHVESIQKA